MTVMELGKTLRDMYQNAKKDEMVVMIHLFGIKYAADIEETGASAKDIAKAAGIEDSYGTETNKGVKLAKYVQVK